MPYIYIPLHYICVNYNDLTVLPHCSPSLGMMVSRSNPKWPYLRLVNYYNLPRLDGGYQSFYYYPIIYMHIYIYIPLYPIISYYYIYISHHIISGNHSHYIISYRISHVELLPIGLTIYNHISVWIITTSLRPHWKSWLVREIIPKWP